MIEPRPEGIPPRVLDKLLPGPLTREYDRTYNYQNLPTDEPSTLPSRLWRRGLMNLGIAVMTPIVAVLLAGVVVAAQPEIFIGGTILFFGSVARMARRFTQAESI